MYPRFCCFIALGSLLLASSLNAEQLELTFPKVHSVIQRYGTESGMGFADVLVSGKVPIQANSTGTLECRIIALNSQPQGDSPNGEASGWTSLAPSVQGDSFNTSVRVSAGGWYRLECRWRVGEDLVATGSVQPFGVGEVFVIGGQSYATNCNDERLTVKDPNQRIVAFNVAKQTWSIANDPQPVFDGSEGGSIWPPVGDALAKELNVPIGFANVAIGGSASSQWLPGEEMHKRLILAGMSLKNFRAVLWQQGESDVIAKNSTEGYVNNLLKIQETFAKEVHQDNPRNSPPWLLAKSTHHPTVYNEPEAEQRIRAGIDELTKRHPFRLGPDTDTLKNENRGDVNSRRHFSAIGQRRAAEMWLVSIREQLLAPSSKPSGLRVGVAESDITPPVGFPMAGYYHERLAEGTIDSLKARAIVFREQETSGALVVCDLIGIATDLSKEVKRRVSEKTGIPKNNIVIAATHSHTAPDYMKELWLYLGKETQEPLRSSFIEKLINGPVDAVVRAFEVSEDIMLFAGTASQDPQVSFNRRFVMRNGSVQTWQALSNPEVVRAAGPIDPRIELLAVRNARDGKLRGLLSNFALHLDTVSGMRWSADYPFFIERTLRKHYGDDVVSIFGTGCCGDINHVDPSTTHRNRVDVIGNAIGSSISRQFAAMSPLQSSRLQVKSQVVELPLQEVSQSDVERATQLVALVKQAGKVEFLDHVTAYKHLVLDQFLRKQPYTDTAKHITWGLSRSLAGIGSKLPVEVTTITLGDELAIVCLPGEVFVELGLAIKQASPYRTTMIVELSNAVETIYVPNRAAYAGGSYEVTNSALQPGAGEMLVEAAIKLLRQSASQPSNP
jgi:neutral ceramidase